MSRSLRSVLRFPFGRLTVGDNYEVHLRTQFEELVGACIAMMTMMAEGYGISYLSCKQNCQGILPLAARVLQGRWQSLCDMQFGPLRLKAPITQFNLRFTSVAAPARRVQEESRKRDSSASPNNSQCPTHVAQQRQYL